MSKADAVGKIFSHLSNSLQDVAQPALARILLLPIGNKDVPGSNSEVGILRLMMILSNYLSIFLE